LAAYLSLDQRSESKMSAAAPAHVPSPAGRVLRSIPVLGRVVREIEREVDTVYYLFVILLTALIVAINVWGLAALVVTAVSLVPVIFVLLIWITLP
jgi:hypothetical protein